MPRFPLSYRWWTVPMAAGLGLWPPLTYAEVADGRFRFRFGVWFALDAPLDAIESAEQIPEAPSDTIPASVVRNGPSSVIRLRTGPGPAVRVRFRGRQQGTWLVLPKLPVPGVFAKAGFDQIEFNAADPSAVVAAIRA